MKPTIVVYGNCNAEALFGFLSHLTDLSQRFEIVLQSSFAATSHNDSEEVTNLLSRSAIVWAQIDEKNALQLQNRVPASAQILLYPPCNSRLMWPHAQFDPSCIAEPDYPFGRFPYGDTLIMRLADQPEVTEDNVLEAYEREMERWLPALSDHMDQDKKGRLERDVSSDIQLSQFFDQNQSTSQLLFTYNHPRLVFLAHLFWQLCEKTDEISDEAIREARRRFANYPEDYEPFPLMEVPVSATLSKNLGLAWSTPDKLHRYYGEHLSSKEYFARYLTHRRRFLRGELGTSP